MPPLGLVQNVSFRRPSGGGLSLGDLAEHAATQIDSRIATANPATDKAIFSVLDHATPAYTRNATCWAADLNLTPLSPWNSDGANEKPVLAISPRHVLMATHYSPAVSSTVRFIAADNTIVTRTITDIESLPIESGFYPDLTIGLLDSDLPSSIGFVKVLPAGWEFRLPLSPDPVFIVDQDENALVADMNNLTVVSPFMFGAVSPSDATRLDFYETVISGDSGHPVFLIINGELVVVSVLTGVISGTSVAGYRDELNALMTTLGGGYQLTEVSLAAFDLYSAPAAPVLSLDFIEDEKIHITWTGGRPVNIFAEGAPYGSNMPSPNAELAGVTNFQEYDIQVKALYGRLVGDFSNTITAYSSYGPLSVPVGETTITVPPGVWTVGTVLWGIGGTIPLGFTIALSDVSDLWSWTGSIWESGMDSSDGTNVSVSGDLILILGIGETPFTIWNGLEP